MPGILRGSVGIDHSSRTAKEAAGFRIRLVDIHQAAPPRQFVRSGQACEPGAEDRDSFGRIGLDLLHGLIPLESELAAESASCAAGLLRFPRARAHKNRSACRREQ